MQETESWLEKPDTPREIIENRNSSPVKTAHRSPTKPAPGSSSQGPAEVIDPTVDSETQDVQEHHDPILDDLGDDDMGWTMKQSRKNKQKQQKAGGKGTGKAGAGSGNHKLAGGAGGTNGNAADGDTLPYGQADRAAENRQLQQQQGAGGGGVRGGRARAAAGAALPGLEQDPFARPAFPADGARPSSARGGQAQQRQLRRGRGRR